jgi:cytochrome b pre-mRNA-processing protein 3
MFLSRLFTRRRDNKMIAHDLYKALVDQARRPFFYDEHQVPDNLDGRFDMILLHLFLILNRLAAEKDQDAAGAKMNIEIQTELQEILFSDMDQGLRELGVGDMGVGKRIRQMAEATFGRLKAYEEAFAMEHPTADQANAAAEALAAAIERNVFRGAPEGKTQAAWLASYLQKQRKSLAGLPFATLAEGKIPFAPMG